MLLVHYLPKAMKHILPFCLAVLFTAPTLFSQSASFQTFIDGHQNEPGFRFALITEKLFESTLHTDVSKEDWNGLKNVIQNLGALRILAGDSISNGAALIKEVKQIAGSEPLDELLAVRSAEKSLYIWVKESDGMVSDLVLVAGNPHDFLLICFSGKLELDQVAELEAMFENGRAEKLIASTQAQSPEFSISPNPGNGVISIQYPAEDDAPLSISVVDAMGRVLKVIDLKQESATNLSLGLPSGTYWLQMETRKGKIGVKQIQVLR